MFRFEIHLTENDFIEFNKFHIFNSGQTVRQIKSLRITFPVVFAVMWLFPVITSGFSLQDFIVRGIIYLPCILFFIFGVKPMVWRITKRSLDKSLKNNDRLFSSDSVIEFGENKITETAPESRCETAYSAVQSVYLADGRMFYIYINSIQAYIVPADLFASAVQYNEFCEFIEMKTGKKITVVNGKR